MRNPAFFRVGDENSADNLTVIINIESGGGNARGEGHDLTVLPQRAVVRWESQDRIDRVAYRGTTNDLAAVIDAISEAVWASQGTQVGHHATVPQDPTKGAVGGRRTANDL